jgi:uncharacterized protein YjiS (DUF1127 family)
MTHHDMTIVSAHRPLPPVANVIFAVAVLVMKWEQRRMTRRALRRMDAHLLDDIGFSAEAAQAESTRPFWRD